MTTYISGTHSFYHNTMTTDAAFRAMGSAFTAALLGAGLVKTSDTGQINWTTITKPGSASAIAGYEVWRFNDSLQGTDPLFIKFQFGTATASSGQQRFRVLIQTGQGSDGAGTLTGQVSAAATSSDNTATGSSTYSTQTYACHTEGYFMMFFGMGGFGAVPMAITISRTKNALGSFDGVGNVVWTENSIYNGVSGLQFTRTGDNVFAGTYSTQICIVPGLPSDSSLTDGSKQLYPIWYADPSVKQLWSMFAVQQNVFPATPTTFSATPFAAQTKTFMFSGNTTGTTTAPLCEVTSSGSYRLAVLWE